MVVECSDSYGNIEIVNCRRMLGVELPTDSHRRHVDGAVVEVDVDVPDRRHSPDP
jgi:hypothetical protein